jgi:hypothetical protein
VKKRLRKDRPSTTITMWIPADVVELLKAVAPMRGFTDYQPPLKSYFSEDQDRVWRPRISRRAPERGGMDRPVRCRLDVRWNRQGLGWFHWRAERFMEARESEYGLDLGEWVEDW